ncbi:hypothetical protein DS843_15045 [Roseomonas genomospecies 6]|uniref:Uncharacterized protein n=1 Tax=Roseomonas genomospecies 6 TaxID=214106 RepID=A0A9W7TYP8_9PROT|nr:hypothetical protein DS843_15045 [Roseomonas genomospecies 6]
MDQLFPVRCACVANVEGRGEAPCAATGLAAPCFAYKTYVAQGKQPRQRRLSYWSMTDALWQRWCCGCVPQRRRRPGAPQQGC